MAWRSYVTADPSYKCYFHKCLKADEHQGVFKQDKLNNKEYSAKINNKTDNCDD